MHRQLYSFYIFWKMCTTLHVLYVSVRYDGIMIGQCLKAKTGFYYDRGAALLAEAPVLRDFVLHTYVHNVAVVHVSKINHAFIS